MYSFAETMEVRNKILKLFKNNKQNVLMPWMLLACTLNSKCSTKMLPALSYRKQHSEHFSVQFHVVSCLPWAHFQLYTILINPL